MSAKLVALEVAGFKSFRTKQTIPFSSEFTAVIGPNGCGKSNILEAIFWGMGESSSSTLRLEKPEDILFDGEAGARFFAEVSLFLERNDAGIEKESLVATRRYHSNGQNIYYLNKQEVKSSLYAEKLQSWGLFRSPYMLMAQGKTDSLMGKTGGTELRLMIEEIAGLVELKSKRELTLKNMTRAEEHLGESQKMWVETTVRHDQLKIALENQAKAESLQAEFERLETRVILLDMYRLHLRMEALETQSSALSMNDSQKDAVREEQAVEMQIMLTRERLKDANTLLLESQKEIVPIERQMELAGNERTSLSSESKLATESYDQVHKKVKAVEQKIASLSQSTDSQLVHLNKLLSMEDELKMRRDQLQNQIRKGMVDLVKKIPRGFKREIERMQVESRQVSEFLTMNDNLIFDLIEQFLVSNRSFMTSLEQIDWEFLETSFREAFEESLSVEASLERQRDKVTHFRASRAKEEESRKAVEQELKDLHEEEIFHRNRVDMIRLRKEALDERWKTWTDSLAKWRGKRDKAQKEGERLSKLLKNFEEQHRHGKRSNPSVSHGSADAIKELYQHQGEFLALKKQIPRESDWMDFLSTAREEVLNEYDQTQRDRDLVREQFFPLRVWLSGDRMQKDFDEVSDRFEQLAKEREDLAESLEEAKQLLGKIDREAKKRFNETLANFNRHLGEISLSMLDKASVQLEEGGSGLVFTANLKGQGKKTLRAFSGGEKTLVFLSFLLAVYAVADVPFTFLDEIDAALDEENSAKWVASLSELSQKRQLILITHNPVVARSAHQILGVTLDKKGYTEVYSLDLSGDYAFV